MFEADLQDLTQEVATCLVHSGIDTTQTWLLVRLKNPDISKTPQSGPVPPGYQSFHPRSQNSSDSHKFRTLLEIKLNFRKVAH